MDFLESHAPPTVTNAVGFHVSLFPPPNNEAANYPPLPEEHLDIPDDYLPRMKDYCEKCQLFRGSNSALPLGKCSLCCMVFYCVSPYCFSW